MTKDVIKTLIELTNKFMLPMQQSKNKYQRLFDKYTEHETRPQEGWVSQINYCQRQIDHYQKCIDQLNELSPEMYLPA